MYKATVRSKGNAKKYFDIIEDREDRHLAIENIQTILLYQSIHSKPQTKHTKNNMDNKKNGTSFQNEIIMIYKHFTPSQ